MYNQKNRKIIFKNYVKKKESNMSKFIFKFNVSTINKKRILDDSEILAVEILLNGFY